MYRSKQKDPNCFCLWQTDTSDLFLAFNNSKVIALVWNWSKTCRESAGKNYLDFFGYLNGTIDFYKNLCLSNKMAEKLVMYKVNHPESSHPFFEIPQSNSRYKGGMFYESAVLQFCL